MLKPSVQVHNENGIFLAEFWDCLRLDLGAVQDLRSKYEAHMKAGGRPEVVVDLLGVGFAGSAALGIFVGIQRLARAKGGRLIFCNVDPNVFEVFRVSKLDALFHFASDRAAALGLVHSADVPESSGGGNGSTGSLGALGPSSPSALRSTGGGALRGRRGRKLS